ncbi:uncharacterized protein LOC119403528 [Rhipicephalus sanguineus]|uniref:uncharacterized protein LOC119391249 n=1 Tax=Rhipicephalus sanguineus TaxID=34632 RepID=UPI001894BF5A|nr:uncharacterized protein LOC119391249 [Rhipicephalus sanguineus]XP_037526386.1 uncharacterized protein LOC119403528 [Rhipicephalus sanguineus]
MLCSSKGAVSAAQPSRGIRLMETSTQDYQLVLPQLPSGTTVCNTVFLHGDLKARPYRVEHFRDALDRLKLMPEVTALGAYQMNHVWAITFKDEEGKKKLLSAKTLSVKDHRCVAIDPCHQDIRMKMYWLLHTTPDEEVRTALAPYGTVTEICREKWRVPGCGDKGSHTRLVSLRLKAGMTIEDIPHQLRVGEDHALVFVPGRAPLCLRCHGTGHIRRECRVPRCGLCRRYGHDETQCVRSYANVTGSGRGEALEEHMMDQADAEATSGGSSDSPALQVRSDLKASGECQPSGRKDESQDNKGQDVPGAEASMVRPKAVATKGEAPRSSSGVDATEEPVEGMDLTGASSKRPRDPSEGGDGREGDDGSCEGPPPKATLLRRATLKPKPNIPPDKRNSPLAAPP